MPEARGRGLGGQGPGRLIRRRNAGSHPTSRLFDDFSAKTRDVGRIRRQKEDMLDICHKAKRAAKPAVRDKRRFPSSDASSNRFKPRGTKTKERRKPISIQHLDDLPKTWQIIEMLDFPRGPHRAPQSPSVPAVCARHGSARGQRGHARGRGGAGRNTRTQLCRSIDSSAPRLH